MLGVLGKIIPGLFGNKSEKDIKNILPIVDRINVIHEALQSISNDELRAYTNKFRVAIKEHLENIDKEIDALNKEIESEEDIAKKESSYTVIDKLKKQRDEELEKVLEEILPEAFAVMKETAKRFKANETIEVTATELDKEIASKKDFVTINGDKAIYKNSWSAAGVETKWDMAHYDVQLIGGIVLHQGKIAEMATGEGKTLVATLPAYLNGLTGMGVHIVTVNDYLARRDSEWMGPIFQFLGLTIDCIDKYEPSSPERRKAYQADIIYGTNNEYGFDYLRDNMCHSPEDLVQRKLHYAMVDEVDSVLVDDARTPLIISGPVAKTKGDTKLFYELKPRIQRLVDAQKSVVNIFLSDAKKLIAEGKSGEKEGGLALLRVHRGLPKHSALIKYLSETGIRAILQKTESYYMQDQNKEMPNADKELFFVIDEKNNSVELTEKGLELITGDSEDPNTFVLPDVGSEIAEIEKSGLPPQEQIAKKDKLMQDFSIKSERIHSLNQLLKSYALFDKDIDYVVMDGKVKIVDENTGRILEGRRYSDGLHQAIEAKENVKVEALSQTFATVTLQNYFRMYHKLAGMTGTAETEAGEFWEIYKLDVVVIPTNKPIVRDDRQDLVYKTKKEKYSAIIEEITKMRDAGRPILVGTTSVEVSELLSRMLKMKGIKHNVLNAKQHQREADIVAEAGKAGTVTIATNMAGRGTDIKLGPGVKDAGGLGIIGSERHESRRIDRQLRGRAGRQGDPGSSQFFVSLEDDLMRLFGSDRIARLMDRMGYDEGEPLQHSMISSSIERAQKKVEENNFGIRKRLLEYDDVMNAQREVIYKKRKHALFGERLSVDIYNTFYDLCEELVNNTHGVHDYENFKLDVIRYFSMDPDMTEADFTENKTPVIVQKLYHSVEDAYKRKTERIKENATPVIENVFKNRGETIQNIVVPFTDGLKGIQVVVNLNKAHETKGKELITAFEKSITLALIDETWKDHLREMDDLKQSVQAAVYEQKDPLLIYKFEAYKLFEQMVGNVNREIASFLFKANIAVQTAAQIEEARSRRSSDSANLKAGRDNVGLVAGPNGQPQPNEERKVQPIRAEKKVGRNEPCPCGSGKKYKHCHGK